MIFYLPTAQSYILITDHQSKILNRIESLRKWQGSCGGEGKGMIRGWVDGVWESKI